MGTPSSPRGRPRRTRGPDRSPGDWGWPAAETRARTCRGARGRVAGAAGRDREHYRSRVTMKGRARLGSGGRSRQRLQGAARAQPPGKERLTAAKPSAGLPELGRGGEGAGSRAETKTKHLGPIFPLQSTAPTVVTRGRRPHQTPEPTRHEDRGRRPPARRGRRLELGAGARDGDTPPPPPAQHRRPSPRVCPQKPRRARALCRVAWGRAAPPPSKSLHLTRLTKVALYPRGDTSLSLNTCFKTLNVICLKS